MAIKKDLLARQACKCMHMQLEIAKAESSTAAPDLVASIQQARAEVGPEGSLPADILRDLCLSRWEVDRQTDWQREWVRRQNTVSTAEDAVKVRPCKLHQLYVPGISLTFGRLSDVTFSDAGEASGCHRSV